MATVQLEHLFKACDNRGTGYLEQEELRELCGRFGICAQDADAIFDDLDHDQDGKINFQDFEKGFSDFLTQYPSSPVVKEGLDPASPLSKSLSSLDGGDVQAEQKQVNAHRAWHNLTNELARAGNMINEETLNALYKELQHTNRPQVVERFGDVIANLLDNMKRLQEENSQLESTWKKEKKEHEQHLQNLVEEMDSQVKFLEQQVKIKQSDSAEAQRRSLQSKMHMEMDQLQTHVSLFEKVDQWLRANENQDKKLNSVSSKLEDALQENRQLRHCLMDTQVNVVLTRNELSQIKDQYEKTYREFSNERKRIMEALDEKECISRQLQYMQETNRKLQDTNDALRSAIETAPERVIRRNRHGSIIDDYLEPDISVPRLGKRHLFESEDPDRASVIWSKSPSTETNDISSKMTPFAEDMDSGLSTLRSGTETDPISEPADTDNEQDDESASHKYASSNFKDRSEDSLKATSVQTVLSANEGNSLNSIPIRPTSSASVRIQNENASSQVHADNQPSSMPCTFKKMEKNKNVDYVKSTSSLPPVTDDDSSSLVSTEDFKPKSSLKEKTSSTSDVHPKLEHRMSTSSEVFQIDTWSGHSGDEGSDASLNKPLFSKKITEIKKQLGVDPKTANYSRRRSASPMSLSKHKVETPVPHPRSRTPGAQGNQTPTPEETPHKQQSSSSPALSPSQESRREVFMKQQRQEPQSSHDKRRSTGVQLTPPATPPKQNRSSTLPRGITLPPVDPTIQSQGSMTPPDSPTDSQVKLRKQAREALGSPSVTPPSHRMNADTQTRTRRQPHRSKVVSNVGSGSGSSAQNTFKVVFVGDASVGKTSFIIRACKGIFYPQLTSTVGVDLQSKTLHVDDTTVNLQLWDTAGQERFRSITQTYFRKVDGVMLLYDSTSEQSFLHVRQWMADVEEATGGKVPVVLVANKKDLKDKFITAKQSVVEARAGENLAEEFNAIFMETSAKDGTNVEESLAKLTRVMLFQSDGRDRNGKISLNDSGSKSSRCCSTK